MSIDFGATVASWCQKIHNVRIGERRDPLLHYTSVSSCLAILESESMWFGEFRAMNDPQELKFGVEFLRRWFETVVEDRERSDEARRFMSLVAEALDNFVDEYSGLFICCLTGSGDRLYHWRSYGDDGKGVALEFDKSTLLALPAHGQDINFLLTPVVYDEKDSGKLVERLDDVLTQTLESPDWLESFRSAPQSRMEALARNTLSTLALVPLMLKSPDYRVEAEWRLIASPSLRGRQLVSSHKLGTRQVRHLPVPLHSLTGSPNPTVSGLLLGPGVKREDFESLYLPIRDRTGRLKPRYKETSIKYISRSPS